MIELFGSLSDMLIGAFVEMLASVTGISASQIATYLVYAIVSIGLSIISGAIFWFTYSRYQEWETKAREGMSDYAAELYDLFDRMFMRKTMNQCYTLIIIATTVLGFLGFVLGLSFSLLIGIIAGAAAGFFGFKLPGLIVRGLFKRRVERFDRQLVDALNMMANAIKSGLSFLQVVQILEQELPNPASQEFGMVLKENRVGVNLNDALLNMTKKIPSEDLFMIMNSVVTLSQQGGDLSEAFDTIANTIRERQRVANKIRTMAQAGITQATILSSLPFVMMGLLYAMQPDFIMLLFITPVGWGLLSVMMILILLGVLWMRKILTIEV